MTEKKKDLIVIIGGIIIIIAYFIITGINNEKNNSSEEKKESKIVLTSNYSMFFTVSNCANRYINILTSKNNDNVIKLLDDNYKKENNITSNNVNEYITGVSYENASIKVTKMYEQEIDEKVTKYYLKGKIVEEIIDEKVIHDDYYLIVTIDNNKKLFSITPYDGQIFKEEQ